MATLLLCSMILLSKMVLSQGIDIITPSSTTVNTSTKQLGLTTVSTNNDTSPSSTPKTPNSNEWPNFHGLLPDNGSALMRAFYVILSVTTIVVLYFIIRAVRLRRRKSKLRKYGIVGRSGDVEMTPLDQEDDDEDTTIFEASNRIRK